MNPRWKRVQGAAGMLGEQIGHLYAKQFFPEEHKKEVEQLVENLRTAFSGRIDQLTWMTDETKVRAKEKLAAFTYKIGYPDKWEDISDLEMSRDSYFANLKNMQAYFTKKNLAKLDKPVDKEEWGMGAHIVNAYYNPLNNEVVFPAGILQPPFYNPDADAAINYGAIGGVIGHEFSHGFDDQGAKYGPNGNLENWWTDQDKAQFEELTERLAEQYDAYEVLPDVHVNGHLTLGENIADLGGLTLAYYAYQNYKQGKDIDPIDGFTDDQRVFLGWAQVWQSNGREEYLKQQVTTDPHSPAEFRVKGPVSNMPEFRAAFGCEEGENIKPEGEEIIIW
ncbi:MAG: Neutral endopeptidase [Cryomorphaceae bacterium]|nr:MAG: Neutral endopeptidase [Cryomorphaceae bacterium]